MSRWLLIIMPLLILTACTGGNDRGLLPVSDAPQRVESKDVPPTGVILVMPGDTVYTIANRYQVTPKRIIVGNNLAPPYDLTGVTTLSVPKPRQHIIQQNETLESIAKRYKVTTEELISLNNLIEPYTLRKGMAIAIPRDLDFSSLDLPATDEVAVLPEQPVTGTASIPESSLKTTTVTYSEAAPAFTWPVNGQIIEPFGVTAKGVQNDGVNIAANEGADVRASHKGEVAFVGSGLKAFGNLVLVKHDDGWITAYAHLSEVTVQEGDFLDRGDILGKVGMTGRVDSPQLHFEIRKARNPVNPQDYLS
jgi:murein DD-endopeptidase MepM/ murein hydrolase activator NlpD